MIQKAVYQLNIWVGCWLRGFGLTVVVEKVVWDREVALRMGCLSFELLEQNMLGGDWSWLHLLGEQVVPKLFLAFAGLLSPSEGCVWRLWQ
jgi:hypothetical protein